jgi:O-antigen/teichoic acid export membrane protein
MDSISGKKIVKNTILNFIGQVIPLLVLFFTMPFIIKGLGTVQFGFLSIVWVIIGNFAVFDLGLGRAINKFVSEAIGKGNKSEVPQIIWTAVTVQLVFGVIGGIIFALISPFLVEHLLKIPANLTQEALTSLYLLAPSIPIILITASLSGVLSAYQRFDIINAVKIPVISLSYILLLICVLLKFNLPEIVAVILLIRVLNLVIFAIFNFRIIPGLKIFSISSDIMPRLFSYGGWVTVSNVADPILVYFERILIGIILSMSAVAYYSVPYEAVTRLWIIPTSLIMVLFPTFSSLDGIGDKKKIDGLFAHSVKYIILGFGVLCLFVILFAKNILEVWVGNNFALKSALPMQILVLGVFISSIGRIPSVLLQAVGRPDITAKFHLVELPVFIVTAWLFINRWGISGAASAWTLRVLMDTILLMWASFKIYGLSFRSLKNNGAISIVFAFAILTIAAFIIKFLLSGYFFMTQSFVVLLLFAVFILFCWRIFFDEFERDTLLNVIKIKKF